MWLFIDSPDSGILVCCGSFSFRMLNVARDKRFFVGVHFENPIHDVKVPDEKA